MGPGLAPAPQLAFVFRKLCCLPDRSPARAIGTKALLRSKTLQRALPRDSIQSLARFAPAVEERFVTFKEGRGMGGHGKAWQTWQGVLPWRAPLSTTSVADHRTVLDNDG